jgi:hypothetical protein
MMFAQSLLGINDGLGGTTPRNSMGGVGNSGGGGGGGGGGPGAASKGGPIATMHEGVTSNPMMSDRDIIKRQEMIIKQQDSALVDIERGVGRLKNKVCVCIDKCLFN